MSKTYAISDLHGFLPLWDKMCKELFKEDDVIYCLGDSGDRGPEPWLTLKTILQDPRVKYIRGNHDDTLANAVIDYFDEGNIWTNSVDGFEALCYNGGRHTYHRLMEEENPLRWAKYIKELPYLDTYINLNGQAIFLTHAGFSLDKLPTEQEALWGRRHYIDNPVEDKESCKVIHGHTYQKKIAERWNMPFNPHAPLWYCGGQKCCIDNRTILTRSAFALDLDTFEWHYFELTEDEMA